MKTALCLLILACASLPAAPAAADNGTTPRPGLAQTERCGPRPMKPSSCLNGAWVCRCRAEGRICDWELIGCSVPDSVKPHPDGRRPLPSSPEDPARPGLYGR
jgi:hypothetical protein